MAQNHPPPIDVTDIQFKVIDKFNVFNPAKEIRNSVNLLATACSYGLMFIGNPNEAELKVILTKELIENKTNGTELRARQVQIPNLPNCIAVSCDGSMLAVNYSQNGCGFVTIYSVPSFTTHNIKTLHNIRLPGDENISALQLLWNPVISGSLAVVMSNGALGMYDFKSSAYEFHTLDSKEQICCGSWSPKGKQIVLGFPNGKLAQYKPDLKLAKTITCPPNIHPGPFRTISIQWLSTFQFAVVFLQQAEDATPSLFIVHAPKAGNPTYINYYDICYSSSGLRSPQVNLMHIQTWNLLLVTSSNGVEVGILGTKETSEAPTWVQYTLLDEARIELPLTEDKDETYPIGFALDTSSTHQMTIAEKKMPVMPTVHILSTHGLLIAFNFLNLQPNTPDICSPPPPFSDTTGMSKFKPLNEISSEKNQEPTTQAESKPNATVNQSNDMTFAPLGSTSTPALEKPKPLFGAPATQSPAGSNMFGAPSSGWSPSFAPVSTATAPAKTTTTFGGFGDIKKPQEQIPTSTNIMNPDKSKPLFTVPPTFNPPPVVMPTQTASNQASQQISKQPSINAHEVDDIINEMILFQTNAFDLELKKLANQSRGLLKNIGSTDEMKTYTKRLNDLQEIIDQANEKEFESDIRSLLNSLNESCAMLAECRSKLNMYKYPDIAILKNASNFDPINRRQLAKLQSLLANNQAQLQIVHNQIDAQWSNFQDLVKRNSRTHMHTPYLEGIYQRMTKIKDMIARERTKINYFKSKLKENGLLYNQLPNSSKAEVTMESLTDTILSMSLGPTIQASRSKLTKEKLQALRESIANRNITIIKPQRPDRVGLKSEVILETKHKSDRKIRDGAATNMDKMEQERIKTEQQRILTKPTATKAVAHSNISSISQPNAPTNFGFGGTSSFVKPNLGKPDDFKKDQQQPTIVKPVASTAGPMFLKATPTATTKNTSAFSGFGTTSNASPMFSGISITPATAPTFTGFGNTQSITFGAPKPLVQNQPTKELSNVDNNSKEQSTQNTTEQKSFSTSNLQSSFTAVAPSKTTESIDKENKIPENFATKPQNPSTVPTSMQMTGFGLANISSTASATFSFGNVATNVFSQGKSTTGTTPFSLSFGSTFNSGNDNTTTSSKPLFAGIAKPSAPTATNSEVSSESSMQQKTDNVESNNDATGFTFSSLNLGSLGLPGTPNLSPTQSISTTESSSGSSATVVKTTSATTSDATDNLFGTLNICKPTSTAESGTFKPTFGEGNLFGSTSFASDSSAENKSIFGVTATSKETTFTGFGNLADKTKSTFEVSTASLTKESSAPPVTTSATSFSIPKTTQSLSFGIATTSTTQGSITTGQATASSTASSVFSTPSTVASIFASAAATNTATTGGSFFGGTGVTFGTSNAQGTPSIFGNTATSTASSPFSSLTPSAPTSAAPITSPFGVAATTTSSSIFASVAAPAVSSSSTSIFGSIPKPDQSVFGQSETNVFAAPKTDITATGGSIFGGQTTGFVTSPVANTGSSIFGGAVSAPSQTTSPFAAAANTSSGSNIFGSPTPNASVFGTPTQATASGGSIFEQSANTGQSGGSIFGGGGATQNFGSPNSPFGGNAASGTSIFGGSATSPKPSAFASTTPAPSAFGSANTGGFGLFSQTPAFGSPSQPAGNTAGGSFAQGGSSITQTGFGSPSTNTAFAKPVFGATPSFGGAPAFGSPPAFGAASAFGSPKGFGSFAAPTSTGGAFTSPTQNNNLFEALGSSDTGLTFGNLAQNNNPNQQKPAFGGSSFMSYRS